MEKLTYEEWEDKFNPDYESGDHSLKIYDWVGEDYKKLQDVGIEHIWTVVDGDDESLYISQGMSFVNRLGYVICNNPRDLKINYEPIEY